ncbi:MAG: flagellar basal body protein FliL [Spirochaetaceae bacterium]|nr:flagellar basal body protein FliL [Spirochaetaceae bacterium]
MKKPALPLLKSTPPSRKDAYASKPAKTAFIISKVLLFVLMLLALVLVAGTVYALVFRAPDAPPLYSFGQQEAQETVPPPASSGSPVFTGIGIIRTTTADKQPATVILSVSFPYKPQDISFTEELNLTIPRFRTVTQEYLSSFTAERLRIQPEETVKADLLSRYNALLRLGKIDLLYFEDFMIIE